MAGPPRAWIPLFVFAGALALTGAATFVAATASRERDLARFESEVQTIRLRVEERLGVYVAMLRGGAGLMDASDAIDLEAFRAYAARLDIPASYPGAQGVGWAPRVLPAEVEAFEQAARAEGLEGYEVSVSAQRAPAYPILYLYPQDRRNRFALGYDMFSHDVRRAAMERARDTGEPAMTAKVRLVQEIDPAKQAGFLVYVPVYQGGRVPDTPDARREAIRGFVYSPFRAGDLLDGIFAGEEGPLVSFAVYDGEVAEPGALLAWYGQVAPTDLCRTIGLEVAGRPWTLALSCRDVGVDGMVVMLGVGGLLFSLALFVVSLGQVRARAEAELRGEEVRGLNATLEQRVEERTADLAEANRELESFIYTVSHDLRAPLRHIAGFARLLEQHVDGQLDDEGQVYVRRIGEAGRRGGQLVDDLLLFSRMGRGDLRLETVPLAPLVEDVRRELCHEIPERRVEWRIGALGAVRADRALLRQVFVSLLSNALKFTRSREVAVIEVASTEGPTEVEISVKDNGVGFEQRYAEKLFGVFERLHTDVEGTGIGTAIVKRIVTRHRGRVWAEGTVGEGATFHFTLPRG